MTTGGKTVNTTVQTIKDAYICKGKNKTNRVETVSGRATDFGEDALQELVESGHYRIMRDKSSRPTIRAYIRQTSKREAYEALCEYLFGGENE